MGIYFDKTTGSEDAQIILQGIKDGCITKDLHCPLYEDEDPYNEKRLVWISLDDPRQYLIRSDYDLSAEIVIINGIPGKLTQRGIDYIHNYLMKNGRFFSTLL